MSSYEEYKKMRKGFLKFMIEEKGIPKESFPQRVFDEEGEGDKMSNKFIERLKHYIDQ